MTDSNKEQSKTKLSMTVLMTPEMSNFMGNVHGGNILKLIDEVAYACASRYSGSYTVTLSFDQVLFKEPIKVGELVSFFASINFVGNTSMEVGVKVVAENIHTQKKRHTNSCYITMVAVDENGRPKKVNRYEPETEIEMERQKAAGLRRELRAELQRRHNEIRKQTSHKGDTQQTVTELNPG